MHATRFVSLLCKYMFYVLLVIYFVRPQPILVYSQVGTDCPEEQRQHGLIDGCEGLMDESQNV